jgi:A/G-specific adenine glycosylase
LKSSRKLQAFSDPQRAAFQTGLLVWYDAHARDLPWREDHDPYRVWLSEIMLQQTRVAAVIAHYHEFLRRFPSVQKLAVAREASVLAAWSGLGYYRRARMLHAAAKVVVRELGGKFPMTAKELPELPGVGRYTAAAIASIAFGEPIAVVDGNVERVLQRVSGQRLAGEKLWLAAERLLDRERPGDFNQAMMELGATVCTPRSPACLTCPVIELCATRGELAGAVKPAQQKKREIHYALDLRDGDGSAGKVFLVQRPPDARLMAGMWELPEIGGNASGAEKTTRGLKSGQSGAVKRQDPSPEGAESNSPGRKSGERIGDSHESRRDGTRPFAFSRNPSNGANKMAELKSPRQPNVELNANSASCFTLKHSITVTNYTVRVWRTNASSPTTGKWFPVGSLTHIALTGLARKVLRKAGILAAPGR